MITKSEKVTEKNRDIFAFVFERNDFIFSVSVSFETNEDSYDARK